MEAWNTACPDWESRLLEGQSLVPDLPLIAEERDKAVRIFNRLRIPDVSGTPKFEDAVGEWFRDIVAALFGAYDPATDRRMIQELFLLVPKKNSKALSLDTAVATPTGFATIADLRVGDLVLSASGRPTKVTSKSPVFLGSRCFEVEFSTGETVVCDAEHLWITDAHRDRGRQSRGDRYKSCPRAKHTHEISATLKLPSGRYTINNHRTALCSPLSLPQANLPIPPYALGYWLGNGASSAANVTIGLEDADHVARQIAGTGHSVRILSKDRAKGAARVSIAEPGPAGAKLPYRFASVSRDLGLIGNKHIPLAYLRASHDQRMSLLRGLMDSDGHVSARGQAVFVTTLPRLRDDARELICSLGYKATVSEHRAVLRGRDCGPVWYVQFWPFAGDEIVSTMARKAERAKQRPACAPRSRSRQIVDVRPVPSVPVQCISIDDPSRQFLVTRSLIPTHNSTGAAGIMVTAAIMCRRPNAELVLVAPTKEIADISYSQAEGMTKADAELAKVFKSQAHLRTLTNRRNGVTIQIKAADTDVITGGKQYATLVDETHVFAAMPRAAAIFLEIRGALASRPDGFFMQITTQSKTPPAGVFKSELGKARDVRDGKLKLPMLPVLYELPPKMQRDNRWKNKRYWPFVNPNLNKSVDEGFLDRELLTAEREGPAQLALFASQHFNIEVGLALRGDRWPGAEHWQKRIDPALTLDEVLERSEVVVVGVDGGGLDDLFGLVVLGRCRETKHWLAWSHAWCHEGVLERRQSIAPKLLDFQKAGELTIVSDELGDISEIVGIVARIKDLDLLASVAVDPAGIGELIDALADIDVTQEGKQVIGAPQGYAMMNAIKTAERKLANGTLWHSMCALMDWCVGNLKIEPTATAIRATKQSAGDAKIDPAMALFNAVTVMSTNPEAKGGVTIGDDYRISA